MKFLKKFETEAEYEAYKNSDTFIEPNVSFIVSNKKTLMTHEYTTFMLSNGEFEVSGDTFKVLKYTK